MNLEGWRIEKDDYDNDSTLRNRRIVDDEQIGGDQEDTGDVAHLKRTLVLFLKGQECGLSLPQSCRAG